MAQPSSEDIKYTVFVKLPFPRGSFVDPPNVAWNSAKEVELWSMLNSTPKGSGIDWEALAEHFNTSPSFLLQQAAWLYERQLSHVREHLSIKHTRQPSVSATTPSAAAVAQLMKRTGSGQGSGSRAPSSLSVRPKLSTELRRDAPIIESTTPPAHKSKHPYSRTTSTTTITQLHHSPSLQMSPKQRRQSVDYAPGSPLSMAGIRRSGTNSGDSSSSSSSDSEPSTVQSRLYTRRPRFQSSRGKTKAPLKALSSADENSDDESPSFLPFSALNTDAGRGLDGTTDTDRQKPSASETSSTTRSEQESLQRTISVTSSGTLSSPRQLSSSIHSASSPREHQSPSSGSRVLSALSPRQRRIAQEESEGTPSMGSSFSDLDDASISRSAMEEALAREIKAGRGSLGVASRIGGLWRQSSAAGPSTTTGSGATKGKGKDKATK